MDNVPVKQSLDTQSIITLAIEKGITGEALTDYLNFEREVRKDSAREQFNKALAEFQYKCPVIQKTRQGYANKYASYDDIMLQIKDLLYEVGLSVQFKVEIEQNRQLLICVLRHIAGHSEETPYRGRFSPTNKGISDTQADGATNTYNKRYALCNALNIPTGDEDLDATEHSYGIAKHKPTQYITQEQLREIGQLMQQQSRYKIESFLKFFKIRSMDQLDQVQARQVKDSLLKQINLRKDN